MKRVTIGFLAACLVLAAGPGRCGELVAEPAILEMHAEALRVRAAAGLTTNYELDEACCVIAQRHANWMAANQNMSHGGGEQIIAMGYATIPGAISAWRFSSGHWAWMGGRSPRAGWGFQRAANGVCYWAGAFAGNPVVVETSEPVTQTQTYTNYGRRGWFRRR